MLGLVVGLFSEWESIHGSADSRGHPIGEGGRTVKSPIELLMDKQVKWEALPVPDGSDNSDLPRESSKRSGCRCGAIGSTRARPYFKKKISRN